MSGTLAAILYFLIPLALTILIEALAGVAFRMIKKEQLSLLLVNIVTNLTVNLLLYLDRLLFPAHIVWVVAMLEIAAITAEWLLLRALCGGKRNWLVFSLACNAASFSAGLALGLIRF